jgi:ubiquinone/menaquinone biosynthesis C-methylase UbiE/Fe2+ or Zn2+ uptake regulation protein
LSTEALLRALRGASEATRLRILALLSRAELTVSELTRILEQSQPRVSRHLKLMCDAGVLQRIQEGSWAFYRLAQDSTGARTAQALIGLLDQEQADTARDLERLVLVKAERVEDAARYFRENAAKWDIIRGLYLANEHVDQAMLAAVGGPIGKHLDIGTGTGQVIRLLAERVQYALGVDASREMLAVARANLESANLVNCQVRRGDLMALPVNDGVMDLVTIHHVLHFLDDPAGAVKEAARTLRTGATALIVDFAPHDIESLREGHAHRRLGFDDAEVRTWCHAAGLGDVQTQQFDDAARLGAQSLTVCLWTATRNALN